MHRSDLFGAGIHPGPGPVGTPEHQVGGQRGHATLGDERQRQLVIGSHAGDQWGGLCQRVRLLSSDSPLSYESANLIRPDCISPVNSRRSAGSRLNLPILTKFSW